MRKSKFKIGTFVFYLAMAAVSQMPLPMQGQSRGTDEFFYGDVVFNDGINTFVILSAIDRLDPGLTWGFTHDGFGAPLGNGLAILATAGTCYLISKKLKFIKK